MTIEVAASASEVVLSCHFQAPRFDQRRAQAFVEALEVVYGALHRSLEDDERRFVASIDHMTAAQSARMAALGQSQPLLQQGHDLRIEQRVSRFARSQPDAPALSFDGSSLSYGELDRLAARTAMGLHHLGVRDGDHVGVCLERSLDLVVVLLGILKAGAVYVPLDPAYPKERLSFTLDDARPRLLIGAEGLMIDGSLVTVTPARLLDITQDQTNAAPRAQTDGNAAAYIIYTSGSTGRPKGVVVPHCNVVSLIAATKCEFDLASNDVWTLFHSSAFDFSVWEIWGCLMTGGHLVIVPFWTSRSPEDLLQLLESERVTVLNQTPSAFSQLQEADRRTSSDLALRLVIFGGEPLDCGSLLGWFDRHPETECRLVNMFGITETTVHVTAETITRRHALTRSRSVGRPLPGWRIYVLDPQGRMLPAGTAGEIYVGGVGVATQYLRREDLTAERFLPDPFFPGRMYRSGDHGKLHPDGRLEHLGRLDNQVKIRGFRIELDEIRAVLLEQPGVTAAAVVVHRGSRGDAADIRLDAYVVLQSGELADLRQRVARVLPDYMTPATITLMPILPLTENGKLDPKRLPPPVLTGQSHATARVTATGEGDREPPLAPDLKVQLRDIWRQVLKVEVGLADSFFDLGGNSLYAVQIASMMRDQGLPRLPLRELYLRQTIDGVATFLIGGDSSTAVATRN